MRELQVIGMDAGGKNVLLQEKGTEDHFTVPADDRLRAAARGDLSRLGQIEVESSSQLRPREIQARVRAGATVAEVAGLAGIPESRVERFAHPVLLERSNAAEMGRKGHPVRSDGPAVQTLDEIVTIVFRARGLDPEAGEWDAWRTVDGEWIVQLAWWAGRSRNTAHWRLYKDGLSGTLTALDDAATELLDPDVNRPLRPLAAVPQQPSGTTHVGIHGPETTAPEAEDGHGTGDPLSTAQAAYRDGDTDSESTTGSGDSVRNGAGVRTGRDRHGAAASGAAAPSDAGRSAEPAAAQKGASHAGEASSRTDEAPADSEAAAHDDTAAHSGKADGSEEEPQDALIPRPSPRSRSKSRKNKPTMPSWEDVLLGVRSNANG